MSVAELQAKTPNFDWETYLDGIGLPQVKTVIVTSLPYLETANAEITDENLHAIKSYLRWHALHGAAPLLSKKFEDQNFDFFNRTLGGQKEQQPRWKRCTSITDRALGEAVGQDWVKQNFPPASKDATRASGQGTRGRHGAGPQDPAVDESRDHASGPQEARCHRRQDRLPQPLA